LPVDVPLQEARLKAARVLFCRQRRLVATTAEVAKMADAPRPYDASTQLQP
jgi:hypothetical protein